MINQIARNFATMGEDRAAVATADHIASYRDPRMRAGVLADVHGLDPVFAAAVALLRRDAHPPH